MGGIVKGFELGANLFQAFINDPPALPAFRWPRRWDFSLNACKSQKLSIGGPPSFRLAISE